MLHQISKLGSVLTREQQQFINGSGHGKPIKCAFSADPDTDWCCHLPQGCPDAS